MPNPLALVTSLLNPVFYGDPRKQEYAVMRLPDGSTKVTWGSAEGNGTDVPHQVQIPDGHYSSVSHNHPNGTTLSYPDLQMLKTMTDSVEAKGNKDYVASRGPHFDKLDDAEFQIGSDMASYPRSYARKIGKGETRQDEINRELAQRGIINYSVNPLVQDPNSPYKHLSDAMIAQELASGK